MLTHRESKPPDPDQWYWGRCQTCGWEVTLQRYDAVQPRTGITSFTARSPQSQSKSSSSPSSSPLPELTPLREADPFMDLLYAECQQCKEESRKVIAKANSRREPTGTRIYLMPLDNIESET